MAEPFLSVGAGDKVTCASTETALYCWGTNGPDGLVGQFEGDSPKLDDFDAPTELELADF